MTAVHVITVAKWRH